MPRNKLPKLREPRGQIVQQVRDQFLEQEYKAAPDDFYAEDVRLVENMDFLLQRCVIMQRKNVEASVKMVSQMLRWRKERRLLEINDRQFPQELSVSGAAFIYENDKFGNKTLYLRASMCKNCAELKPAMKDFLAKLMYDIDDPRDGAPYAVIMDLTNTTLTNYDLDLLQHVVALLKDYFPVNLDYFLAINFPWILSAVWSLIKRLIPAEKRDAVQFISSDKVFDFIARENCPDFLGGTCTRPYSYTNPEALTSIEFLTKTSNGTIAKKRLREILAQFDDVLPEDHKAKLRFQIDQYNENSFNNNEGEEDGNEELAKPAQLAADKSQKKTKPSKKKQASS